jgi:hypothetical protein
MKEHDQSGNMRDYNRKMIDMAHANAEAAFELARQLANAKAPSDIVELWASYARKQFEMLSEQTKDLTALGQKSLAKAPRRRHGKGRRTGGGVLPQAPIIRIVDCPPSALLVNKYTHSRQKSLKRVGDSSVSRTVC